MVVVVELGLSLPTATVPAMPYTEDDDDIWQPARPNRPSGSGG